MRKGPSETSHKDLINHRTPASAQSTFIQHGSRSDLRPSLLLALPAESLTHITSYLDPASLFVLGRTNKTLAAHIKDDNTWHSAFVCQFLGVGPEGDLHHADALTLRRSEPTWKREFVLRHHVRMRWLRSRVSPVTHTPHYTTISDIYMLPDDALLSSSIQYGIVARSQPLTGKIVKGYLNAAGTHHPAAAGNPNAEFTPDISACAIATDGPSARILWARRDGSVAVMWHPRTMVGARAAARISTSRVEEEHQGPVSDAVFSVDGQACITAAADGRVKIWSLRRFGCVWTSPPGRVVEPLTHVREDLVRGAIVCATEKGAILVHSGFDLAALHTLGAQPQSSIKQYRIPVPSGVSEDALSVDQLFVDPFSRKTDEITLLVRRGIGPVFYRYDVNLLTGNYTETLFGSPAGEGYVQVLCPVFKNGDKGEAFVLAGTNFGSLCIYAWDARPRSTATLIPPTRRVDVFPDAHATAIAFHANVIAVGSASGTVRVFDTLTLAPLKAFAPHGPGHVQRILLRRDMLVVAVGTHVLAWKGLPIGSNARNHANAKGKAKKEQGERKWAKQIALRNDIAESAAEVDIELVGDGGMQRSWGQERAQAELGLSEREAVEYVLMLSRDEVLAQEEAEAQMFGSGQDVFDDTSVRSDEEGVFELDGLDNDFARAPSSSSGSSSSEPSPLLRATNSPTPGSTGSPSIRAANSTSPPHHASPRILRGHSASNNKVQVSPRVAPEPTEAGGLSSSPLTLDPITVPRPPAGHDFPTMASGATARSSVPLSTPGSSVKSAPGSAWSSPRRSAWATPLRTPSVSSSPSVPRSPPSSSPAVGLLSQQVRNWDAADGQVGSRQEDGNVWEQRVAEISAVEDEELRFALELSLAEERSRLGL